MSGDGSRRHPSSGRSDCPFPAPTNEGGVQTRAARSSRASLQSCRFSCPPAPALPSAVCRSLRLSGARWQCTAKRHRLPALQLRTESCRDGAPVPPASASLAIRARTSSSMSANSLLARAYSSRNSGSFMRRFFRSFSLVMLSPAYGGSAKRGRRPVGEPE